MAKVDFEARAALAKRWSLVFVVISALIPILALLGVMKPEAEALDSWFQRCGALIVFFASIGEYFSLKILSIYSPGEEAGLPDTPRKSHDCSQAQLLSVVSFVMIGLGTLIWGYGDLFW